jgi:hypothetical protein
VLSLFSSRWNWDSPTLSYAGECASPLFWFRWEGHTCLRERGWRGPNSDAGNHTVVLYVYMYFVLLCKDLRIPNLPLFYIDNVYFFCWTSDIVVHPGSDNESVMHNQNDINGIDGIQTDLAMTGGIDFVKQVSQLISLKQHVFYY